MIIPAQLVLIALVAIVTIVEPAPQIRTKQTKTTQHKITREQIFPMAVIVPLTIIAPAATVMVVYVFLFKMLIIVL